MDAPTKSTNTKKKPFKLTRQLIRMALHDGWTQKEIAEKCRTQQSVVSAWSKGAKFADEQQLKPLLELYGHRLRRNTFRVYWGINQESGEKSFYRVEGKVILSQAFTDPRRDNRGKLVRKIPIHKLVIHHQGENNFRVIFQSRLKFQHSNEELECSVEDAVWSSKISEKITIEELLKLIDSYAHGLTEKFPSDANTLPFIIRQSLLNHGFSVNGIENFPASW
jgi:transcriptional regulator with XRE-family HTH domain